MKCPATGAITIVILYSYNRTLTSLCVRGHEVSGNRDNKAYEDRVLCLRCEILCGGLVLHCSGWLVPLQDQVFMTKTGIGLLRRMKCRSQSLATGLFIYGLNRRVLVTGTINYMKCLGDRDNKLHGVSW